MIRKVFMSTITSLVTAVSLATVKMRAERKAVQDHAMAGKAVPTGSVRYGPYPTGERAHQMAAYFARQGYDTHVVPWGTTHRSYYVDIEVEIVPLGAPNSGMVTS
jgi:hypothetical protein